MSGGLHSIAGRASTGPAVVLVHGFPFDSSIWQGQVDSLGEAARVYAPDLPGFGRSPSVGRGKGTTVGNYAGALARWAEDSGLSKIVLAGHSMGGYVAFAFARRFPEMLSGLILVATKAGADTDAARENRYKLAAAVGEQGPQAVVDAMLPKLLAPETVERDPGVAEQVRATMLRQRSESIIAALHAMASRPDSSPDLNRIKVPTLIISGAQDAIMPAAEAEAMHAGIAGSAHVALEGTGHLPMLEDPGAFNSALQGFLAGS